MFETLRNALEVAEVVENCFKYEKDSCIVSLDDLNQRTELDAWEQKSKERYASEIDLINDIEKLIKKWVRDQM